MPNHADFPPLQVALLALPETTPTTLHAFLEVFSGVGVAWGEVTGRPVPARRVEARIVARSTTPLPRGGPLFIDQRVRQGRLSTIGSTLIARSKQGSNHLVHHPDRLI